MKVKRYENNPIITVKDVKPSRPGWKVHYVMNAGCHRVGERCAAVAARGGGPGP